MFNTIIQEWFSSKFNAPTDIQKKAWESIDNNNNLLITAPTGSGKTLAAFLYGINALVEGKWNAEETAILYVSPLKALNADIQVNLRQPLEELREMHELRDIPFPPITVALRSGDTTQQERRQIFKSPPSIFITTPETLHLLLSQERGRTLLSHLKCAILDEIHSIAENRRGALISANLERLVKLSGGFMRIGLSATVNPLALMADFISGNPLDDRGVQTRRPVKVLADSGKKESEIFIEETPLNPGDFGDAYWQNICSLIHKHLEKSRSSIVFVNSRKMSETITRYLNVGKSSPDIYPHHGSLSKNLRKNIESLLRKGELKAITATNSLELGIDVGFIDTVIFVQPPFTISSFVQKLGRAGHQVGAVSKGICIPLNSMEKFQFAAYKSSLADGLIERIHIPQSPLDVLSQFLISESLVGPVSASDYLHTLQSSYTFRNLDELDFYQTLRFLCGMYKGIPLKEIHKRLEFNEDTGYFNSLKGTLQAFYSSAGTIPDRGNYSLKTHENRQIGELDEQFVWERRIGDVFTLGNHKWRILSIDNSAVTVEATKARENSYVFWKADQILTKALPHELTKKAVTAAVCHAAETGTNEDPFISGLMKSGLCLKDDLLYIENTALPGENRANKYIFIHTFAGGEINKALQFAIEGYFQNEGILGQVYSNNRQVVITSFESIHFSLLEIVSNFTNHIYNSIENSGFFGIKFREITNRFIILSSPGFGKRRPLWMNRSKVKQFFLKIKHYRDNPVIKETWREIIENTIDIDGALELLSKIQEGFIKEKIVTTKSPSPLCDEAVFRITDMLMYTDDTPLPSGISSVSLDFFLKLLSSDNSSIKLDKDIVEYFECRLQSRTTDYCPDTPKALCKYVSDRIIVPIDEFTELSQLYFSETENTELPEGLYRISSPSITGITDTRGIDVLKKLFALTEDQIELYSLKENTPVSGYRTRRIEEADELLFLATILGYYGPVSLDRLVELYKFNHNWTLTTITRIERELNDRILRGHFVEGVDHEQIVLFENIEQLLQFSRSRKEDVHINIDTFQRYLLAKYTCTEEKQVQIKKILNVPYTPSDVLDVVLKLRLDDEMISELEGLIRDRAVLPLMKREKLLFLDASSIETMTGNETPGTCIPRLGSFTFWELKDQTGLGVSELAQELKKDFTRGKISCDSLEGIQSILHLKAADIEKQSFISFREWQSRRIFPGRWYSVPDVEISNNDTVEGIEYQKSSLRTLLTRYGIIWRTLLKRESSVFGFSVMKKVLRLMELSGEIVSGFFIEEVSERQYAFKSTLKNISDGQHHIHTGLVYCKEPVFAYDYRPEDQKIKGNYFIIVSDEAPFLLYYPKQKHITGVTDTNIRNIGCFFEKNVIQEIQIKMVNGESVFTSDFYTSLLGLGGVRGRNHLRIDRYSIQKM